MKTITAETIRGLLDKANSLNLERKDVVNIIYTNDERMPWVLFYFD